MLAAWLWRALLPCPHAKKDGRCKRRATPTRRSDWLPDACDSAHGAGTIGAGTGVAVPMVPSWRGEAQALTEQRSATTTPRRRPHAPPPTVTAQCRTCSRLGCVQITQPTNCTATEPHPGDSTTRPSQRVAAAEGRRPRWHAATTATGAAARGDCRGCQRCSLQQRTLRHHQLDAIRRQHTLLHREALLVLPTLDLEDVALELVANVLAVHLSRQTLVVQRAPAKRRAGRLRRLSLSLLRSPSRRGVRGGRSWQGVGSAQLLLIVDLDELLAARARVGDVQLRPGDAGAGETVGARISLAGAQARRASPPSC